MKRPIPIVFCVDVEPDRRLLGTGEPDSWNGFEATLNYIEVIRCQLERSTGSPVRFNWFIRVDPQVERVYGDIAWPINHYADSIRRLQTHGDAIGLHVHAYRWQPSADNWLIDHANQPWIADCLYRAFDGYTQALDSQCTIFRFGDRFMNNETMSVLETLGVRVDLTIEPGQPATPALDLSEPYTGRLPSYENIPHEPYVPRREDFRKPDTNCATRRSITVLPMTSGLLPTEWFPAPWYAPMSGAVRRIMRRPRKMWTPMETANLARPTRHITHVVEQALCELEKPYLAVVIRSSTPADPPKQQNLESMVQYLTEHPLASEFVLTDAESAIGLLA